MEQDKTFGLAIDIALTQILLGMVAGTAKITNLSVADGYVNISIRAKVDSIQINGDPAVKASELPPTALTTTALVDPKPDQAKAVVPNGTTGPSVHQEAVPENEPLRLNQPKDPDKRPALPPSTPDLEELDDVASAPGNVQAAEPGVRFELEDLE